MTALKVNRAAAYIRRCTAALENQVSGPGNWKLALPEPTNEAERMGLKLILAEVEKALGISEPKGHA
jgi:hypothetical protein